MPTGRPAHSKLVEAVAFSPDGQLLASAGLDHTLKFWNARTGALVRSFTLPGCAVPALAFAPDGHRLVTGQATASGIAGTAKLCDVSTARCLVTYLRSPSHPMDKRC